MLFPPSVMVRLSNEIICAHLISKRYRILSSLELRKKEYNI